ncbi:agamous-like MADS-box protein AGL80 [Abrus precatorius]|uniref:Agamous-like MADS-box protein AGL80 n=1 Tax=Abrus precatorius TaxID=3816 RepID=A0A8B8K1I3_ABRPR|nr:agamous-like MADS-box protein AGL80 [Abrus precatorius]
MTRKKVELTYIANESKRKATLKKRKNGLIKKIDEISTLCGIEACAIIYSPNDELDVWPSELGVQRVLSRFKSMSEHEQGKKMLNQESFLSQSIIKAQEQLKKQKNENRKKEMSNLMFECLNTGKICDNASMIDLNDLSWLIDQNLKEIERNMSRMQIQEVTPIIENGGETMNGGQQVNMDNVQVPETNMDNMQRQHWTSEFINGVVGDDMLLPFGDVNIQNGLFPNPYIP